MTNHIQSRVHVCFHIVIYNENICLQELLENLAEMCIIVIMCPCKGDNVSMFTTCNETCNDRCLHDFLKILKHSLQNF